ncbi:MAG: 3-hydroxyacyl-CoA dehydrogenase NAD-binding domain-containing protein, partial [Desulfobacterales bacterium]
MSIQSVMVVGSGLMGSGIAQVCAQAGIEVLLYDISKEVLDKALKTIDWSVGKFVEKGKLTEEKNTIIRRIDVVEDLSAGSKVNLIIEAVFENLELKQEIFRKLDQICAPETLIASNTSAIPISEIASVTNRSEKVLGLHFFSPVPMMQAVEVIKGIATSDETFQQGKNFVILIGKE